VENRLCTATEYTSTYVSLVIRQTNVSHDSYIIIIIIINAQIKVTLSQ